MRRLILLISLLLLSTGWVLAQSNTSGAGPDTNSVNSDSQHTSGSDMNQGNTGTSTAPQSSDTGNVGRSQGASESSGSQDNSMGPQGMSHDESGGGKTSTNEASGQGSMSNSERGGTSQSSDAYSQGEKSSSLAPQGGRTAGMTSVTGCLAEDNGQFTLTDKSGNTFQLTGKSATLKAHVGHKIRVRGKTSSESARAGENQPGSMSGGQGGQTLHVTSIQHLSSSCNMMGGSSAR